MGSPAACAAEGFAGVEPFAVAFGVLVPLVTAVGAGVARRVVTEKFTPRIGDGSGIDAVLLVHLVDEP
jgi:hypothetical protein